LAISVGTSASVSHRWRTLLFVVPLIGSLGCGGSAAQGVARVPLTGKVTYNGQPVAKGILLLQPKGAGQPVSTNVTDGTYAFTRTDGPSAGGYHVTVTRIGAEEVVAPANRGITPGGRNFPPPRKPVDRPAEKSSFELDYVVPGGDAPTHDFELKD